MILGQRLAFGIDMNCFAWGFGFHTCQDMFTLELYPFYLNFHYGRSVRDDE